MYRASGLPPDSNRVVPKKYNHLFERIASFRALHEAALRAICGKRSKPGAAGFMANLERNLLRMERTLRDGTWRGGGYTVIHVYDPKPHGFGRK